MSGDQVKTVVLGFILTAALAGAKLMAQKGTPAVTGTIFKV
jgi:hypothetical protein